MAGVDVSVKNEQSQAAIVVVTYPGFLPVETVLAQRPTPFPYVPGLLSFREGPVLEEAFEKLKSEPDVFLFDGMGIAHPRRIGIASHMGLWLQRPTVGCGKTLLCGRYKDLAEEKGSSAPLIDRKETIGVALRTRTAKNPMFISPATSRTSRLPRNSSCAARPNTACPSRSAWRITRRGSFRLKCSGMTQNDGVRDYRLRPLGFFAAWSMQT
ncbi:endonuclease V [Microvirga aerilata]